MSVSYGWGKIHKQRGAEVARGAHNPEVVGSKPTAARIFLFCIIFFSGSDFRVSRRCFFRGSFWVGGWFSGERRWRASGGHLFLPFFVLDFVIREREVQVGRVFSQGFVSVLELTLISRDVLWRDISFHVVFERGLGDEGRKGGFFHGMR